MEVNPEQQLSSDKDNNDREERPEAAEAESRWEANSTTACRQTKNRRWDTSVTDVDRRVRLNLN